LLLFCRLAPYIKNLKQLEEMRESQVVGMVGPKTIVHKLMGTEKRTDTVSPFRRLITPFFYKSL